MGLLEKNTLQHIVYFTNEGNIKPAITVFPERIPGQPDKIRGAIQ